MLKSILVSIGLASSLNSIFVINSAVAVADEVSVASQELEEQIKLCDSISVYLERIDQGRLKIIKESSAATLASIKEFGLGNMNTMNLFQLQIITYKYSERYFESIRNAATEDSITELNKIAAKIEHDRGGPFLYITNYIFKNQEKNFRELRRLVEGQPLAQQLDSMNLWAEFGNVIAISAGGDRPNKPFCEAVKLYGKIQSLYNDLDDESASSSIFDVSQSIIGLNEFYREYANVDEVNCSP